MVIMCDNNHPEISKNKHSYPSTNNAGTSNPKLSPSIYEHTNIDTFHFGTSENLAKLNAVMYWVIIFIGVLVLLTSVNCQACLFCEKMLQQMGRP